MNSVRIKYPSSDAYTVLLREKQEFDLWLRFPQPDYVYSEECLDCDGHSAFGIYLNTDQIKPTKVILVEKTDQYFDLQYTFEQNHQIYNINCDDVFLGNVYCKNQDLNLFVILRFCDTNNNLLYYCSNLNLDIVIKLRTEQKFIFYIPQDFKYKLSVELNALYYSFNKNPDQDVNPILINNKIFHKKESCCISGWSNKSITVTAKFSEANLVRLMQSYIRIYSLSRNNEHNILDRVCSKKDSTIILINPGSYEVIDMSPTQRRLVLEILSPVSLYPSFDTASVWDVDFEIGDNQNADMSLSFKQIDTKEVKDDKERKHSSRVFEFLVAGSLVDKKDCSIVFSCKGIVKKVAIKFDYKIGRNDIVPLNHSFATQDGSKIFKEIVFVEIEQHDGIPFKSIRLDEIPSLIEAEDKKISDDTGVKKKNHTPIHIGNRVEKSDSIPTSSGQGTTSVLFSDPEKNNGTDVRITESRNTAVVMDLYQSKRFFFEIDCGVFHQSEHTLYAFSLIQSYLYLVIKDSKTFVRANGYKQICEVEVYREYLPKDPQLPFYLGSLRVSRGLENFYIQLFLNEPTRPLFPSKKDFHTLRTNKLAVTGKEPEIEVDVDRIELKNVEGNFKLILDPKQNLEITHFSKPEFQSLISNEKFEKISENSWKLDLKGSLNKNILKPKKIGQVILKQKTKSKIMHDNKRCFMNLARSNKSIELSVYDYPRSHALFPQTTPDLVIVDPIDLSIHPLYGTDRVLLQFNKKNHNLRLRLHGHASFLNYVDNYDNINSEMVLLSLNNENVTNVLEGWVILSRDIYSESGELSRKITRILFSLNEKFLK